MREEIQVGDVFISYSSGEKVEIKDIKGSLVVYQTEDGREFALANTRFVRAFKKMEDTQNEK